MKLTHHKKIIIFITIILLGIVNINYLFNKISENNSNNKFISLFVNSNDHQQDRIIHINETKSLVISVDSNEHISYALIKIKITNNSSNLPDQLNCEPSNAPLVFEQPFLTKLGETNIPINMIITKVTNDNISMYINDRAVTTNIYPNNNFNLIFELWIYEDNSNEFSFSWVSRSTKQCIWTLLEYEINLR